MDKIKVGEGLVTTDMNKLEGDGITIMVTRSCRDNFSSQEIYELGLYAKDHDDSLISDVTRRKINFLELGRDSTFFEACCT